MYEELVKRYSFISLRPRQVVDELISRKMVHGLTREEAIKELYKEVFAQEESVSKAKTKKDLEEALEDLKMKSRSLRAGTFIIFALLSLFTFILFLASPWAAMGIFFILFLFIMVIAIAPSYTRTSWRFNEEIVIEGAGEYIDEIIKETPIAFQEMTLQNTSYKIKDNTLIMSLHLEKTVVERSTRHIPTDRGLTITVGSSETTKLVDLGYFNIKADFERRDGDLVVKTMYEGSPPLAHGDIAAEVYERVIVAFRSAIRESYEKLKPKKVVTVDFVELAKLVASLGIVMKAVKCPNCGASVDLPEKGDIVKCPYCNTTIKAIDVYEMVKRLLKEV